MFPWRPWALHSTENRVRFIYRFIYLSCKLWGMCYVHKKSNHSDNIFLSNLFLLRCISQYIVLFRCCSSSPVWLRHLLNFAQRKISFTLERQRYFAGLTMTHASSAVHFLILLHFLGAILPQAPCAWLSSDCSDQNSSWALSLIIQYEYFLEYISESDKALHSVFPFILSQKFFRTLNSFSCKCFLLNSMAL